MISPVQQEILATLTRLRQLAPDVRFGQMLAQLGLLAEDRFDRSLWEVEDQQFLELLQQHRGELCKRQEHVA